MQLPQINNFLPSFILEPKEFQKQYKNVLENQKYVSKVQEATKQEILKEMERRLEGMKSQAQISRDKVAELEKDPSYQARQTKKAEEETLKNWEMRIDGQQKEIDNTKDLIDKLQENQADLAIFSKKAEEVK